MKIIVDFSKKYSKQTELVKNTFCETDYNEIKSLLNFKNKYKKSLTK